MWMLRCCPSPLFCRPSCNGAQRVVIVSGWSRPVNLTPSWQCIGTMWAIIIQSVSFQNHLYPSSIPCTNYRIVGNFRKFVKNTIFTEKTFADCSLLLRQKSHTPNFAEKTFTNSHKTAKFANVFSLKSFPLYSMIYSTRRTQFLT